MVILYTRTSIALLQAIVALIQQSYLPTMTHQVITLDEASPPSLSVSPLSLYVFAARTFLGSHLQIPVCFDSILPLHLGHA